jgi:hypothetical protein
MIAADILDQIIYTLDNLCIGTAKSHDRDGSNPAQQIFRGMLSLILRSVICNELLQSFTQNQI